MCIKKILKNYVRESMCMFEYGSRRRRKITYLLNPSFIVKGKSTFYMKHKKY